MPIKRLRWGAEDLELPANSAYMLGSDGGYLRAWRVLTTFM